MNKQTKVVVGILLSLSLLFLTYVCVNYMKTKDSSTTDKFTEDQDMKSSEVDNKVNILFFYADWCGHCKTFKPEFQKFQDTLHLTVPENKYQIKWMNADDESTKREMSKYDITGFPTVICDNQKKHVVTKYNGQRTEKALLEYFKPLIV